MGDILVYVEQRGGRIESITLELLSAARQLAGATGGKVEALVLGADPGLLAASLGACDRILAVAHPALERYTPEAHEAALVSVVRAREPAAVLLAYNTVGLDLAPALAQRSGRALVGYVTKLSLRDGAIDAESRIYGGKLRAMSRAELPVVLAITPGAYPEAATSPGAGPEIVHIAAPAELASLKTSFVAENLPPAGGVDLTQADKILCVGRGIRDKDSIELARTVADALGAELGGSRPVIDNGWLSRERQVGKSGSKVKPKLYLAVGISGAPEHLEGMGGAELIVAINTDANAPIFGVAHHGTTCDLFELLPRLGQRLASGRTA